jgi:ABC-type polysaccharide/polyol phosphate transport system ATPase subunit
MFLHADHVSIDFALSSQGHGLASVASAQPLGGRIHATRRRTYVRALDDVSFRLGSGDRLALVGHNGSGKSTLLRVLAGIYHPTAGSITSSNPVSGIFNMSLGFRPEASGYRNIVLKGLIAGRTRAEIEAALPGIAEFTGLGPYLDMPLHTYSQGMAMRIAFATTTAFSNDILVMDEWIGAGDAAFQEKIIDRMNDFLHASTIIVLASHSANLLRRIANKVLWLEQGGVRQAGGLEVLDAYEADVAERSMDPALRALVGDREGLWLLPAGAGVDQAHLVWNLRTPAFALQLRLQQPQAQPRVVRPQVASCGSWPVPAWARPGMRFEIASAAQGTIASVELPEAF